MAKLTIIKKSKFMIELKAEDGQVVLLGYKKNGIQMRSLQSRAVGDVVELEVETSNNNRLYCSDQDDFLLSMQKADLYQIRQKTIAKASEGF